MCLLLINVSYACTGHVEQRGKKITCVSKDGEWVFEMQGMERIYFIESGSSEYRLGETRLPDGAIFQLEE